MEIEKLGLDVTTYNALKRAGINTIEDIENNMEELENLIPKKIGAVKNKISEYYGIPILGTWVEEDVLGEELTFDEITDMVGEIIIIDQSTESRAWYKAARVERIAIDENGDRRLVYFDGAKKRGIISEMYFDESRKKHERAWRVKQMDNMKQQSPSEISAPAQSETAVVFDYSELDTDTAASLRNCETVIRTETAGYFTLLGAKFKEAQDLLANHSSGTFEQWYTAMGFKRQTVYNLIKRFEFSSSPTIGERAEVFEALPLTLSYEISKPDAPAELVDKVLDGDITSNAEYQKLKKQLEEAEEKREFWIKQNSETNKENQQLRTDRNIALTRADNAERKLSEAKAKIKELECEADEADREYAAMADREDQHETLIADLKRQIKELESRPVEVAVEQDTAALAEKDKLISELKEEIERLSDNSVKSFVIKLTIEEYVQLQDIVKSSDNHCIVNAVNSARMIKL